MFEDFRAGAAWRETDEGETDASTVVEDLLHGQYGQPLRIVAFKATEGWAHDVTEDIAWNWIVGSPRPRGFRVAAGIRRDEPRPQDRPAAGAAPFRCLLKDKDDEYWTEKRRKRLKEKLEPELEQIRYDHIGFRGSVKRLMSWRSHFRRRNANRPD